MESYWRVIMEYIIWNKCFGIVFLSLIYLPPWIPSPVPNSISFKPFHTQFSKFWFAQKQINQQIGCITQSGLALHKPQ